MRKDEVSVVLVMKVLIVIAVVIAGNSTALAL